jgi:hypothetical protein
MLFREMAETTLAISQPSHAWISGQAIKAWGNAEFGIVTPYEEVCLGAEQHDIGWLLWEQAPTLNLKTGRPHSFRELDVEAHTNIWSQGTAMALSLGRYPALLVSLHGAFLYRSFDFAAANAEKAAIVRAFLEEQSEVQQQLIVKLEDEKRYAQAPLRETLERNRGLVSAADRLSIAICTGLQDVAVRSDKNDEAWVRKVPTAHGEADIRVRAVNGSLTHFTLDPWPFAAVSVRLICEASELPRSHFSNQAAMQAALRSAKSVLVTAELHPA